MAKSAVKNIYFLSGNEALARGAYEAGVRVAASYPGTPASEILESLAGFDDVDSQWSVNEKVAYEVSYGAAIGGLRSLYASKHVGLNVAMDPLMTSAYTGTNAGLVVVSSDDPGIHSSQNEQDSRHIARFAKLPLLEPSSPKEAYFFVKEAFKISERFNIPVMVRLTTRISHTKENISLGTRSEIPNREFKIDIPKYVMVPKNARRSHELLLEKIAKVKKFAEKSGLNKIEIKDRKLGIITSSVSYLYAKESYPEASFLKLGISFPFPEGLAKEFAAKVSRLYVIEELEPYLEEQLKLSGVKAKTKHVSFSAGELRPEYIPYIIKGREKPKEILNARKPLMCPGCPHRSTFWALKKLKAIVSGDIGCYTLGALAPLSSLHSCLCMGAGITVFEGLKRSGIKNVVGVIGDSTFVHSGITGLINLAYNEVNGLIIILDNSTTAMTGNQPHPGTGLTIKGSETKRLMLEEISKAAGADSVIVVDAKDAKKIEALIKDSITADILSVLIVRSPCRLIDRTKSSPPSYIREQCKKCYQCLAIDCPAVSKSEDGFVSIDYSVCTGCNLCVQACPFQALRER